jgi:hypothetical protein
MTMTTEANQVPGDAELATIFPRLFGETPDTEEYEYVRVPGLHLASELEDVIEPGPDYVVWQAGEFHDGRMLLAVYCRRPKTARGESSEAPQAPRGAPGPARATMSVGAAPKPGMRKRSR